MQKTVCELFAGVGGFRCGLNNIKTAEDYNKKEKWDTVWFSQWEPAEKSTQYAHDCYVYRFGTRLDNNGEDTTNYNIEDVDKTALPDFNLLVGGFPCQGFSLANRKRTLEDERNQLYKFFYSTIKIKQPKFFIAENVRGILSLGKGEVIKQIVSDFEEAGYITTVNLVNMANYGVPQTRQRVLIIGQRKDYGEEMLFQFPQPTFSKDGKDLPRWISIKDAIDHFPDPDTENNVINHIYSAYKVEYRNYTGHRKTDPNKPSPTILARGNGKGGVCAIPHYNGKRRLSIRESASVQTFPEKFHFIGSMNSCYRQIGNAVPVKFAKLLGEELIRLEHNGV